jgi:hypothetical protein
MPLWESVRNNVPNSNHVIPAQAGNQFPLVLWFPACAGMTKIVVITESGNCLETIPYRSISAIFGRVALMRS